MNKLQAIREARINADAIIEQLTRRDNGWDKGAYRDDVPDVDKSWAMPISLELSTASEYAFALSAKFAGV